VSNLIIFHDYDDNYIFINRDNDDFSEHLFNIITKGGIVKLVNKLNIY
jgi:hypothetical protein